MKRRWTATANVSWCVLKAQSKSGRKELERRLLADDPCWHRQMVFSLEKAWDNKHFRRGLAIQAQSYRHSKLEG